MTTHCWGVDPGFASSPTGVALVRFDGLAPHLVGAWTIRPRGRDWQARIDDVLGQLLALISPRVPVLAPRGPVLLAYELSYIGENAQSALRLAQLGGGVRGIALALGLPMLYTDTDAVRERYRELMTEVGHELVEHSGPAQLAQLSFMEAA